MARRRPLRQPQYTGPIMVSTTTTINAIAAGGSYSTSTVASGTYTIIAATPTYLADPVHLQRRRKR